MNSRSNPEFLTGLRTLVTDANTGTDAAACVDGDVTLYPGFGKGG